MKKSAKAQAALIDANVEDWYQNRIDYQTFFARSRVLWQEIDRAGNTETVLAMFRRPFVTSPFPLKRRAA